MLNFVGLGLYDKRSMTLRGRDAVRAADTIFAEFYTSQLTGSTINTIEATHGIDIKILDRAGVEENPEPIFTAAKTGNAVFLTGGDPMVSTTHIDLRLRAANRGIKTQVVHGTTAQTAASSLSGLQNYRFGKATTLPFSDGHGADGVPTSVLTTIEQNRSRELHTLIYLDIDPVNDRYMRGNTAAKMLGKEFSAELGVVIARAGADNPTVRADSLDALADTDFGEPLHLLVIPASLHDLEAASLREFADAPANLASGP